MTQPSLTAFFNRERLIAEQLCLLFAGRLHEALKEFLEKSREALHPKVVKIFEKELPNIEKAYVIKPAYWNTIEPMYSKIEAVYEEMLMESKLIVRSLHEAWSSLNGKCRRGKVNVKHYEDERARLRAEACKTLKALKEKYDEAFSELERRIEAYFRGRKPLKPSRKVLTP
ncbi:MAG: hypothetical protein QXH61_01145 [Candidatus Nezhaarchaeales archaeon]